MNHETIKLIAEACAKAAGQATHFNKDPVVDIRFLLASLLKYLDMIQPLRFKEMDVLKVKPLTPIPKFKVLNK